MKFLLAILAGASLAALPVAASGADAAPPEPCLGAPTVTDPAGDQKADVLPVVSHAAIQEPTEDNTDLRSVFFNLRTGADGKPALTANIQVTNLTKDIPALAKDDGMSWTVYFTEAEAIHTAIQARNEGGEISYRYQEFQDLVTVPDVGTLREPVWVETTGEFHEGLNGVISMTMPAVLAKEGVKLTAVYARAAITSAREETLALANSADTAPDEGSTSTKSYTVTACPAATGEPPATDTTGGTDTTSANGGTPPPSEPAPQQPQQQPAPQQPSQPAPQQQAPGTPLPATGTLVADAAADKGKRKTAMKRGLRMRVRCSVQCKATAVATIDKRTARKLGLGKKAVKIGTGKASITKAGRIPFYVKLTKKAKKALKRKGVKKFALTVAFTVTDAQGKQVKKVTRKSTLR